MRGGLRTLFHHSFRINYYSLRSLVSCSNLSFKGLSRLSLKSRLRKLFFILTKVTDSILVLFFYSDFNFSGCVPILIYVDAKICKFIYFISNLVFVLTFSPVSSEIWLILLITFVDLKWRLLVSPTLSLFQCGWNGRYTS